MYHLTQFRTAEGLSTLPSDRSLRRRASLGLLCSTLLHLAVAVALIFLGLPQLKPAADLDLAIPIDLVRAGETTASPPFPDRAKVPLAAPDTATQQHPSLLAEAPLPPPALDRPRPDHGRTIDPLAEIVPPRKPPPPVFGKSVDIKRARAARLAAPTPPNPLPQSAGAPADATVTGGDPDSRGPATYDVKDIIRAQIERRWNFDVAARRAPDMTVSVHVVLGPDGSVDAADIINDPRYASNPAYHALAISARDAVLVSSPLRLPPGAYSRLADTILNFSPSDVLR